MGDELGKGTFYINGKPIALSTGGEFTPEPIESERRIRYHPGKAVGSFKVDFIKPTAKQRLILFNGWTKKMVYLYFKMSSVKSRKSKDKLRKRFLKEKRKLEIPVFICTTKSSNLDIKVQYKDIF